jgi:hypothetical protein
MENLKSLRGFCKQAEVGRLESTEEAFKTLRKGLLSFRETTPGIKKVAEQQEPNPR